MPKPEVLLSLSILRPKIDRLFLEGNNITDAGAKNLAGMHDPQGEHERALLIFAHGRPHTSRATFSHVRSLLPL